MKPIVLLFILLYSVTLTAQKCRVAMLESNSSYSITGDATLEEKDGKVTLSLSDDFSTDTGPDIDLYFSKTATFGSESILLSAIQEFTGAQTYVVDNSIKIEDYNYIHVHCTEFDVPWGIGEFKACMTSAAEITGTHIIEASNFTFTPKDLEVEVGDTVVWKWLEGHHTTTSSSVPEGADTWDAPLTAESTSFSYVVKMEGTYDYVCTPHQSIGMVGSFFTKEEDPPTGISKTNISKGIDLFPNPASDLVNVNLFFGSETQIQLKIFNLSGSLVFSKEQIVSEGENNIQLNLKDLSSGSYMLLVQGSEGEVHSQILLKQ